MSARFWHSGPAVIYGILDTAPLTLVQNALNPSAWMNHAVVLGTCEQYPQIGVQYFREDVRNDLGGDAVIAKPLMGISCSVRCNLNRWDQVVAERIQTDFSGARTGLTGVMDVAQTATMTDLLGNSVGILVFYTDVNNRPEEGLFVPMATIEEWQPIKIGNRTAAISMAFNSNTAFTNRNGRCVKFDFVKYPNGTGLDNYITAACPS
ncbi:MAG: hypothetical protein LW865_17655 [Betaproteobacteria bacterium]|jgi:hypothetical protein|nr:hypothetical protein [Betaproteobacteria bacterium]